MDCIADSLTVNILVVGPLLCGADDDILPDPLKFPIGERLALAVGDYEIRVGRRFCFLQAGCQALGDRYIPFGCRCL